MAAVADLMADKMTDEELQWQKKTRVVVADVCFLPDKGLVMGQGFSDI